VYFEFSSGLIFYFIYLKSPGRAISTTNRLGTNSAHSAYRYHTLALPRTLEMDAKECLFERFLSETRRQLDQIERKQDALREQLESFIQSFQTAEKPRRRVERTKRKRDSRNMRHKTSAKRSGQGDRGENQRCPRNQNQKDMRSVENANNNCNPSRSRATECNDKQAKPNQGSPSVHEPKVEFSSMSISQKGSWAESDNAKDNVMRKENSITDADFHDRMKNQSTMRKGQNVQSTPIGKAPKTSSTDSNMKRLAYTSLNLTDEEISRAHAAQENVPFDKNDIYRTLVDPRGKDNASLKEYGWRAANLYTAQADKSQIEGMVIADFAFWDLEHLLKMQKADCEKIRSLLVASGYFIRRKGGPSHALVAFIRRGGGRKRGRAPPLKRK